MRDLPQHPLADQPRLDLDDPPVRHPRLELGMGRLVGQTPLGTGMTGFSIGTAFQSYHFQVAATGNGPDNALSQHTQSFYVVGPGT